MREEKVFVGEGLDAEGIKDVLNDADEDGNENMLLFEVAHALLTEHQDDRAEIHSVGVDEVAIDPQHPNQVHLEFTTSWSSHYGCRDMDDAGEQQESEGATYTADGHLVFTLPTPRRPANEC